MPRISIVIVATALLFILPEVIGTARADSSGSTDVQTSTPTPKKKSGFFKNLGRFVETETGLPMPGSHDKDLQSGPPDGNSRPAASSNDSAKREPTRSEIDQSLNAQMAASGMDTSKRDQQQLDIAKHTRIPKNAAEAAELDQVARDKGMAGCMVWMHPVRKEDLATLDPESRQAAEEYQRNIVEHPEKIKRGPKETPDGAMWNCRGMVMETRYQLVKASGDPGKIRQFDAEYAEFGRQADAAKKNASK